MPSRAARFWNGAGGASLALYEYGAALEYLGKALSVARGVGDMESEARAYANYSSIYLILGDAVAAESSLDEALRRLPADAQFYPLLLVQRSRIAFRRGDYERAIPLILDAIDTAEQRLAWDAASLAWDNLGLLRLAQGDLPAADAALSNSFRLRVLHKLPHMEAAYARMAHLRLLQDKPDQAIHLLDLAKKSRRESPGLLFPWITVMDRGAALAAVGKTAQALECYRHAWDAASSWRQEVLPAQTTETAADLNLSRVASSFAYLSAAEAERLGRPDLLHEGFAALEQNRAAGLRRFLMARTSLRKNDQGEYALLLSELRRLSSAVQDPAAQARLNVVRSRLTAIEAAAGLPSTPSLPDSRAASGITAGLARALGPQRALFSFLLDEPHSRLFVLTSAGLVQATLPGRDRLAPLIERFRRAVASDQAEARELGRTLYSELFSAVPSASLAPPHWLISFDDPLLLAPLAALVVPGAGESYLAERKTLTFLPSALSLTEPAPPRSRSTALLAGDAVYNRADRRLPHISAQWPSSNPFAFWLWPLFGPPSVARASSRSELASLAGARQELEAVSRELRRSAVEPALLTGTAASLDAVERSLAARPGIIHLATHVVARSTLRPISHRLAADGTSSAFDFARPGDLYLALSLRPDGTADALDAAAIAGFDLPGSLVVLSGCGSGVADVLPGAGLLGLSRAWMAAGASTVVATLWPVTDDSGLSFEYFYRELAAGSNPSVALQTAQKELIASRSWRAKPRHWAAYFLVGKE